MRVAILDDAFDTLRCFELPATHEVTVYLEVLVDA